MGCGTSSPISDPEAEARTREIDRQLEKERQTQRLTMKILLLGTGESGKSTVLSMPFYSCLSICTVADRTVDL